MLQEALRTTSCAVIVVGFRVLGFKSQLWPGSIRYQTRFEDETLMSVKYPFVSLVSQFHSALSVGFVSQCQLAPSLSCGVANNREG